MASQYNGSVHQHPWGVLPTIMGEGMEPSHIGTGPDEDDDNDNHRSLTCIVAMDEG